MVHQAGESSFSNYSMCSQVHWAANVYEWLSSKFSLTVRGEAAPKIYADEGKVWEALGGQSLRNSMNEWVGGG